MRLDTCGGVDAAQGGLKNAAVVGGCCALCCEDAPEHKSLLQLCHLCMLDVSSHFAHLW
jgi:hypothetical protein